MIAALDESILNVTLALIDNDMIQDSIIIFTTDNGGAAGGMELGISSNYPLKGGKFTVWEGGIRGVAFVYSEQIEKSGMFKGNSFTFVLSSKIELNSLKVRESSLLIPKLEYNRSLPN